jgi:ribose transport system ATP-binding protein
VPEDRQAESLLLDVAVQRNITLAILPRLAQRWGFLNRSGEQRAARQQAEALQIKAPSLSSPARVLSGGNQQKTALAKWLAAEARAILPEPTRYRRGRESIHDQSRNSRDRVRRSLDFFGTV